MPQLRDSGTAPARTEPYHPPDGRFCRIFGVETEYGVAVTGAERPVDAGQVAMTMFQPIVSRSRSTNTYLPMAHVCIWTSDPTPNTATAEARDPREALAQDLAGEHVMRNLALKAQRKLRESYGAHATIHVFKNKRRLRRPRLRLPRKLPGPPLRAVGDHRTPAAAVPHHPPAVHRCRPHDPGRLPDHPARGLPGRGRLLGHHPLPPDGHTRDEPHADPDSFRRLHVIIGDSNRSQWSTWMKLAVTHLVLCAIEDAFRHGVPSGFEQYAFADPAAANRTVSRFLDNPRAELTLESGESVSALGLQRRYYAAVKAFIETHGDALASSLPATTIDTIMGEWSRVLDALERGAYDALADRVDWAAKKRLFDALKRRRPDAPSPRWNSLELDYHDIANGRLYGSLVARNQMRELLTGDNVEYAVHNPPTDTRAALRGRFVDAALRRTPSSPPTGPTWP